jgi:hypothetical protein
VVSSIALNLLQSQPVIKYPCTAAGHTPVGNPFKTVFNITGGHHPSFSTGESIVVMEQNTIAKMKSENQIIREISHDFARDGTMFNASSVFNQSIIKLVINPHHRLAFGEGRIKRWNADDSL